MSTIRANVPLQILRGIFVHGEIIQMHTIHVSNHTVIKQPHDGKKGEKN